MKRIKEILSSLSAGVLLAAVLPMAAGAAPNYSLQEGATKVAGQNNQGTAVRLVSDTTPEGTEADYSLIDFNVPDGTTLSSLSTLSTDFNPTDDGCVGGSPRFQLNVDDDNDSATPDKNIFVYLGTDSGSAACQNDTWQASSDLLEAGKKLDTSQLSGGTLYDTYENALTNYGNLTVTGIQLVVDSGWASDNEMVTLVDNININGTVYAFDAPTNKEQCKNDGWREGDYKNQGDCVSSFTSKKQQGTTTSQSMLDRIRNLFR